MKQVEIYTDGACRGNPGRGGFAAILVYGEHERIISGGEITENIRNTAIEMLNKSLT